jgi:hypothetical protein
LAQVLKGHLTQQFKSLANSAFGLQ